MRIYIYGLLEERTLYDDDMLEIKPASAPG